MFSIFTETGKSTADITYFHQTNTCKQY